MTVLCRSRDEVSKWASGYVEARGEVSAQRLCGRTFSPTLKYCLPCCTTHNRMAYSCFDPVLDCPVRRMLLSRRSTPSSPVTIFSGACGRLSSSFVAVFASAPASLRSINSMSSTELAAVGQMNSDAMYVTDMSGDPYQDSEKCE